ncbi:MAG TPA: hypothetical protein PK655_02480 [archaeon]|jgi:hypothetical protein|nr:hypothetical protein [archaeon]
MNQKGASAILVTSLIIVVVVILSVIFFAWSKNYSKEQMDVTSGQLKQASDLSCINANFKITSCNIDSDTKTINFVFVNNSNLKIFNLVLTIHANETIISGAFEKVIDSGEITSLSTATDFTYVKGEVEHQSIDVATITDIILTNGTCPKKVFTLDCEIV